MGRFVSDNDSIDSGNSGVAISFDDVLNTPTTLAGYGITDAARANNIEFNSLVNRPTTLAGYGITDATTGGGGGTSTISPEELTAAVNAALANNTTIITVVNEAVANNSTITTAVNTALETSLSTALAPGGIISDTYVRKVGGDTLVGNYNVDGNFTATGAITAFGEAIAPGGTISTTYVKKSGGDNLTGNYSVTGNLDITGNEVITGNLTTTGTIAAQGAISTQSNLTVGGSGAITGNLTTVGFITAQGDITAFSDERLKKDWTDLPIDFIEQLATIKHGNYTRIDTNEQQVGVSAQELQQILPNAIKEDDNTMLSIAYGNASLVAAIELAKEVVSLKKIIADLVILVNEKNGL